MKCLTLFSFLVLLFSGWKGIQEGALLKCEKCEAGQYQLTLGQPFCLPCLPGTKQNQAGSSSCDKCEQGKFIIDAGHETNCDDCGKGTFQNEVGKPFCKSCPPGTWSSDETLGSIDSCINCTAGTYSTAAGAQNRNTCTGCPPGKFGSENGAKSLQSCNICGENTFSQTGGTYCRACPDGRTALEGSGSCTTCPAGTATVMLVPGVSEYKCQTCKFRIIFFCTSISYFFLVIFIVFMTSSLTFTYLSPIYYHFNIPQVHLENLRLLPTQHVDAAVLASINEIPEPLLAAPARLEKQTIRRKLKSV